MRTCNPVIAKILINKIQKVRLDNRKDFKVSNNMCSSHPILQKETQALDLITFLQINLTQGFKDNKILMILKFILFNHLYKVSNNLLLTKTTIRNLINKQASQISKIKLYTSKHRNQFSQAYLVSHLILIYFRTTVFCLWWQSANLTYYRSTSTVTIFSSNNSKKL